MERGKNRKTFREKMKASEWAFDRIKEAFDLVAQDEARKVSIVQEVMFKSTDYLRRLIAPVEGQGRCHNVLPMPALQQLPSGRQRLVGLWEKTYKVVLRNVWRKSTTGDNQTGCWSCMQGKFRAGKGLLSACGTSRPERKLTNALKLQANQQEDGDSLLQSIVTNFGKESRKGLTACVNSSGCTMMALWMVER